MTDKGIRILLDLLVLAASQGHSDADRREQFRRVLIACRIIK